MSVLLLAQDAADTGSKSLLQYIHSGGVVSYILVCVSLVAVALLIRNALIFRADKLAPPDVFERIDAALRRGDTQAAMAICADPDNASFLSRVFGSALLRCSRSPFGFLELRTAIEESGQREADRLHRYNDGVGIIAAVGPMLGLLGTVLGMIGAFATLGGMEGAARSRELARFMSYALVCTAEGLAIAIPCTIAFSLFRRRVDHLISHIADQIEHLTSAIEQSSGAEPARPARPAAPRQEAVVRSPRPE
ncbi:MAG: MotA/TolQ/ExbB proton channel family protein [Phycisphaerae bacterium]|nr:MotA/TolQ/ExbB proton channel family protein [Phycisphaerae bacterium]